MVYRLDTDPEPQCVKSRNWNRNSNFSKVGTGTGTVKNSYGSTALWYLPALMSPVQVVMAWLEEMQAMVTVWAGIRSEKPAPRAASRATLLVFTS
jgi:hypothetical protein